ncbi:MAG: hypothetical protein NTW42_00895 [Deltaproteobacteria bacterium]|nr:hypothetical protein [Deltaproteobacteria bacterium]
MWAAIKKLAHDCCTGIDGTTYDPARVVGYGSAAMLVSTFAFALVVHAINGQFDAQASGIGAAALLGGVAAVGGGVALKSKTEPAQ